MPLSNEELQFLATLSHMPEGRRYIKYLSSKLSAADVATREANPDKVAVAQGRARAFAELLEDLQEAENRLKRSSTSRRTIVANPADF